MDDDLPPKKTGISKGNGERWLSMRRLQRINIKVNVAGSRATHAKTHNHTDQATYAKNTGSHKSATHDHATHAKKRKIHKNEHWLLKTDPLQFTAEFTTNTSTHIITNMRMRKHSEELRATEEIRSIRRKTGHDPTPRTQEHETHWSRHARKNTRFADHGFTEKSSNPPRNTPLTHPRNVNRGRWCENTRSTKTGFSQMSKKVPTKHRSALHKVPNHTTANEST